MSADPALRYLDEGMCVQAGSPEDWEAMAFLHKRPPAFRTLRKPEGA